CPTHGGGECDAPVFAVIDPSKSGANQLVYSTFLNGQTQGSGDNQERISALAIDNLGRAYLTGTASTTDFPTTGSAFQTTCANDCIGGVAFLSVIDPGQSGKSSLVYSTYLGGSQDDNASGADNGVAIAVGSSRRAYLTGQAGSEDFPVTNSTA